MHDHLLESTLELIKKDIPTLQDKDLLTLTSIIQDLYSCDTRQELNSDGTAINAEWAPNPSAVKEVLGIGVRIVDLDYCIRSFIDFAKEKGYTDNLSIKFVTHIKIMSQQGKLSLMEGQQ